MNVNVKQLENCDQFDQTKITTFSTELKVNAYTMKVILFHFTSNDTQPLAFHILRVCLKNLRQWLMNIGLISICGVIDYCTDSSIHATIIQDCNKFSFHLPIHRFFAGFLNQAVRTQGICIKDIIPQSSSYDTVDRDALLLAISTHPLGILATFYEIMQDAWVHNGLHIKRQARLYINPEYCSYMIDTDIYLLQLCLSELSNVHKFMGLILKK